MKKIYDVTFVYAGSRKEKLKTIDKSASDFFYGFLELKKNDINTTFIEIPDKKTGKTIVKVGKRYFRPTEVDALLGDSRKAKKILKWKPKITFNQMVKEMVESDYKEQKKLIS